MTDIDPRIETRHEATESPPRRERQRSEDRDRSQHERPREEREADDDRPPRSQPPNRER